MNASAETRLAGLDQGVRNDVVIVRHAQSRLGRRLREIEKIGRTVGFGAFGVTTFAQYCEKRGLSAVEGFQIKKVAEAFETSPRLEEEVNKGEVSHRKAAAIGEVLKRPELQKPDEDIFDVARRKTSREMDEEVRKRKEEARVKETTVARTLYFTRLGLDDLARVRELESRRKRRSVTESEAAQIALSEHRDRHDPERKAARAAERKRKREGQRSAAPVEEGPPRNPGQAKNGRERSRHVPAAEKHEVISRHGDRCAVDGCDARIYLELSHDKAWRFNGENAAHNLFRYCYEHHKQHDAGLWKVVKRREGALMVNSRGMVVGRLRRPQEPEGP